MTTAHDIVQSISGAEEEGAPEAFDGPLIRPSLSQQIANRLRDEIVHGDIPAGTHLVQVSLCERFGTSRMPVRDALLQLTQEGLLNKKGGYREVARLGADDLLDVLTLIGVLHGWAAGRVAETAPADQLRDLDSLYQRAINAGDALEFSRVILTWHKRINLLAGSTRLIHTIVALQQTVPRVFPFSVRDDMDDIKNQHRSIMDSLLERDGPSSERLIRKLSTDMARSVSETFPREAS